jgi:UDP-glucose 4-epimerase
VGTAVTHALQLKGHDVVAIDRREPAARPVNFHDVDLADFDAVLAALDGCDRLVHLAGIAGPNEAAETSVHANNVVASYHALSAAARLGITRVVQASSINAIGASWSRQPHFDYLPVDENHPTYNEDGYSLSKWIAEQQADSIVRRYPGLSVASLRFHAFVPDQEAARANGARLGEAWAARGLWGYTTAGMIADACVLGCTADFSGHHVLFIVAPSVASDIPTAQLCRQWYPDTPVRTELRETRGLFDCSRAVSVLGWPYGWNSAEPADGFGSAP